MVLCFTGGDRTARAACAGDCIMRGLAPPASVTVVQDNRGEGEGLGQGSHLPLVSHPQGFHRIWMDMTAPDARRLCFWAPVPRPG